MMGRMTQWMRGRQEGVDPIGFVDHVKMDFSLDGIGKPFGAFN